MKQARDEIGRGRAGRVCRFGKSSSFCIGQVRPRSGLEIAKQCRVHLSKLPIGRTITGESQRQPCRPWYGEQSPLRPATPNEQASVAPAEGERSPVSHTSAFRLSCFSRNQRNQKRAVSSTKLPGEMSTIKSENDPVSEHSQVVTGSAPPPIPFERLKEIANSVSCLFCFWILFLAKSPLLTLVFFRRVKPPFHQHQFTSTRPPNPGIPILSTRSCSRLSKRPPRQRHNHNTSSP